MADINLNFGTDDLGKLKDMLNELAKVAEKIKTSMAKDSIISEDDAIRAKILAAESLKVSNEIKKQERVKAKMESQDVTANNKIKEQAGIIGGLERQVKQYTTAWKGANTQMEKKEAKKNLDDIKHKLTQAKDVTATWGKALGSFQFKFNALGNIAGNVISGITSKITSVIKEFTSFDKIIKSTQGSGDNFAATMGGMKSGFDALNRAIVTGDFSNFLEKFKDAVKAGKEYILALDDVSDRQRAVNVRWAESQVEIAKLEGVMKLKTNSDAKRAEAANEIHRRTLEHFEELEAVTKQEMDTQRNSLMQTYHLNEAQANSILDYVKNYDRLTRAQYENIGAVTAAYNEYMKYENKSENINKLETNRAAALRNNIRITKEKYETLLAGLTEEELKYIELDKLTGNVLDKERDKIASVSIAWANAQRELVLYNNKADKAISKLKLEDIIDPEINKVLKESLSETESLLSAISAGQDMGKSDDKYKEKIAIRKGTAAAKKRIAAEEKAVTDKALSDEIEAERKLAEEKALKSQEEQKALDLKLSGEDLLKRAKIDTIFAVTDAIKANAKDQQAVAIGEAIISQALAISEVWKRYASNPPLAFAYTALAVVQTSAQIAAIRAQKFALGGEIGGNPHSRGGTTIEAERGEFVVRKESFSKHRDLVKAINSDDTVKLADMMSRDRRVIVTKETDYSKKMYDLLNGQEHGYETNDYYVIVKGNMITKLNKN